jgi:hypothetical protein
MTEVVDENGKKNYQWLMMEPQLKKVEGKGWTMYRVGLIIRIDIKGNK